MTGRWYLSAQRRALLEKLLRAAGIERNGSGPAPLLYDRTSTVNLAAEALLDPAIAVTAKPRRPAQAEPQQILLTGATGFLGAFLLAELLRAYPYAVVICLARAAGAEQADARIEANLRRYGLWREAMRKRVIAVAGDLERPRLGLPDHRFRDLVEHVDVVFHNGARMHLMDSYARMRAANVGGTQEVLRMAAPQAVPVHFISTSGVLVGRGDNPDVLREDHRVAAQSVVPNAYLQTKWVAEELVRQAHQRGVPTAIYRPSRIVGDTCSGATGVHDAFWAVLKACVEVEAVPDADGWQAQQNLVPVDYVASAVVHLARNQDPDGRAYHLTNPVPVWVSAVIDRIRSAGHRLAGLPGQEWADRVSAAALTAAGGSAVPLVSLLVSDLAGLREHTSARIRYDQANTLRGLSGSGIECPPVGRDLLDRYLRYLTEVGFLPEPVDPPHDHDAVSARRAATESPTRLPTPARH